MQSGVVVGGYGNGTAGNTLNALRNPAGLALDSVGSLYVCDFNNHRVIKFTEGSLKGALVAGTGVPGNALNQLNNPSGIFIDPKFNLYMADAYNSRVMFWQANASMGTIKAGNGTPANSPMTFNAAGDVVLDSSGNMFVSDHYNGRVMRWAVNASSGTMVAGTGVPGNGDPQLNLPYGLFWSESSSYLYIADSGNDRIQRYYLNSTMNVATVAGGNGAGSGAHQLNNPYDLYVSERSRTMYIVDYGNHRIQRWDFGASSGVTIVGTTGITGTALTLLSGPSAIIINSNETSMYISDMMNNRILKFQLL